jgi:hypothetical protein
MSEARKRVEEISKGRSLGQTYPLSDNTQADLRADLRELLAESDRLRSLVEEAKGVVEPFARIAPCFDRHILVEVCEPHPDNPSPRIQPLTVGSLVNAKPHTG